MGGKDLLLRVLKWTVILYVLRTTLLIVLKYVDYFPPNFSSDFLLGREGYFYSYYRWAFYTHVIISPPTLIVGLLLLSTAFRTNYVRWHRRLGKMQVVMVLFFVAPSGLIMARHAQSGFYGGISLAVLAIATAITVVMGWCAVRNKQFNRHQLWMTRCYILLSSAVVLRTLGGLAEVFGIDGIDPFNAWACWIVPLLIYEWFKPRQVRVNLIEAR